MLTHNSYLDYKRSTTYLTFWLCQASNTVIQSFSDQQKDDSDESFTTINTTGQVTSRELVAMAQRVAVNLREEVPCTIFRLFRSVIKARSKAYEMFRELAATQADKKMEESNLSHKHYIDRLDEAFTILGGKVWMAKQQAGDEQLEDLQTTERIILTNPFSVLASDLIADELKEDDDNQTLQSTEKLSDKGKQNRRKGKKKAKSTSNMRKEAGLEDIPLERYHILDGPEDLITDYYIAVTSIIEECHQLRAFIHVQWYNVSHKDLNGAIAGTISCLAIGMVRRTIANIFVEFPAEEDTYEAIMQTFTRGDFKTMFSLSESHPSLNDTQFLVEEALSMYVYRDLYDFLVDYQKNRNGRPTKRMRAYLSSWDPEFDLTGADKNARIGWRRRFTINWLYDLVNVHSYSVRQSPCTKVEGVALEALPWSSQHTSFAFGQLLGIEEFAGVITTLVMQKPGTDVADRILMWHVFQLQCIVDATTVHRGWSSIESDKHMESAPHYSPRQDIDVFLTKTPEIYEGFYWGAKLSLVNLEDDASKFGDPDRYGCSRKVLERLAMHIQTWLGASEHVFAWSGVPSRFSQHDSNGLWNYSPFLCGTGLTEALELTYRGTMVLWDKIREPLALVHLHNMVLQKGFMDNRHTILSDLTSIFADSFFDQGMLPTEKFDQAWRNRTQSVQTRSLKMQRLDAAKSSKNGRDLHSVLTLDHNLYFRRKSNLLLFREAGWDPERIPESDMEPNSALGRIRMQQTKPVLDLETGKFIHGQTELIQRAISRGATTESLTSHATSLAACENNDDARQTTSPPNHGPKSWSTSTKKIGDASNGGYAPSGLELLKWITLDVSKDISGCRPVTGLNYMWISSMMLEVLNEWERHLESARNILYVQASKGSLQRGTDQRAILVHFVLQERSGHEECLKLLAKAIEKLAARSLEHICWQKASIMQGLTCCGYLIEDTPETGQTRTEKTKNETNGVENKEKTKGHDD